MAAIPKLLLGWFIWALVLGPIHAHADTTVTQYGSNGGYGENGGDVNLTDVAGGSGNDLYLSQNAYGGAGGDGDNSVPPGEGGSASSDLSGLSLGTDSTSYNATATGGQGGQSLVAGISGGLGGSATATATASTPSGTLNVNSSASGSPGGSDPSGNFAAAGNALATSTGTAPSGSVGSYATSNLGNGYFVNGQASAPIINGTSISVAGTNVAQPLQTLADGQGKQAVAFGTALPSNIDTMLAQYQKVYYAFNGYGPVLGYGVLGGMASSRGSGTYNSSLAYNLSIQGISNPQHLIVGLLSSSFSGPGFGSLEFSIVDQGQHLFDQTFSSASSAQAFFNDNVIDLGLLTSIPLTGSGLELTFNYSLVASNNSGGDFNFIYGNGVPLPGSVWFLASGLVGLMGLKRKFFR